MTFQSLTGNNQHQQILDRIGSDRIRLDQITDRIMDRITDRITKKNIFSVFKIMKIKNQIVYNGAFLTFSYLHIMKLLYESHSAKQLSEGPGLHYVTQTLVWLVTQHFLFSIHILKFSTFMFYLLFHNFMNDLIFQFSLKLFFFLWSDPWSGPWSLVRSEPDLSTPALINTKCCCT